MKIQMNEIVKGAINPPRVKISKILRKRPCPYCGIGILLYGTKSRCAICGKVS